VGYGPWDWAQTTALIPGRGVSFRRPAKAGSCRDGPPPKSELVFGQGIRRPHSMPPADMVVAAGLIPISDALEALPGEHVVTAWGRFRAPGESWTSPPELPSEGGRMVGERGGGGRGLQRHGVRAPGQKACRV